MALTAQDVTDAANEAGLDKAALTAGFRLVRRFLDGGLSDDPTAIAFVAQSVRTVTTQLTAARAQAAQLDSQIAALQAQRGALNV